MKRLLVFLTICLCFPMTGWASNCGYENDTKITDMIGPKDEQLRWMRHLIFHTEAESGYEYGIIPEWYDGVPSSIQYDDILGRDFATYSATGFAQREATEECVPVDQLQFINIAATFDVIFVTTEDKSCVLSVRFWNMYDLLKRGYRWAQDLEILDLQCR